MQRYFVKEKNNNEFILKDSDIHHIKKVMRCTNNDKIEIVYENKVYLCNIDDIDNVKLSIIDIYEDIRPKIIKRKIVIKGKRILI